MKIFFFCYRSWAINAVENIVSTHRHLDYKIVTIKNLRIKISKKHKNKTIKINPINYLQLNKIFKNSDTNICFLIGWSWIIKTDISNNVDFYCLHPSDLPKFRGGSPIQHQLLHNVKKTKMTLFKVNRFIDGGKIYKKAPIKLDNSMNYIFNQMTNSSVILINKFINDLYKNKIKLYRQNLTNSKIYKRIKEKESFINYNSLKKMKYLYLYNLILSLEKPYPNLKILYHKNTYRISTTSQISKTRKIGFEKTILIDKEIYIKFEKYEKIKPK